MEIDDFATDSTLGDSFMDKFHRVSVGNDGDIGALLNNIGHAKRNWLNVVDFDLHTEDVLGNQNEGGVIAMDCAPKKPGGVLRGARNGDSESRNVGKRCFVTLAVPE